MLPVMISLHLLQARYADSAFAAHTARTLIQTKCRNMAALLSRALPHRSNQPHHLRNLTASIHQIKQAMARLNEEMDTRHLFLLEARASSAYWKAYAILIRAPHGWRRIHPHAGDTWNQALNIGYTILFQKVKRLILQEGLDPEIGIFHASRSGKNALAYDLMELFRQSIVDTAVIRVFSRKAASSELDPQTVIKQVAIRCARQCVFYGRSVTRERAMELEIARFKKAVQCQLPFVPTRIRL